MGADGAMGVGEQAVKGRAMGRRAMGRRARGRKERIACMAESKVQNESSASRPYEPYSLGQTSQLHLDGWNKTPSERSIDRFGDQNSSLQRPAFGARDRFAPGFTPYDPLDAGRGSVDGSDRKSCRRGVLVRSADPSHVFGASVDAPKWLGFRYLVDA